MDARTGPLRTLAIVILSKPRERRRVLGDAAIARLARIPTGAPRPLEAIPATP